MQSPSEATLAQYINNFAATPKTIPGTGVFAMRVQTAPFGHNAPKYTTLPTEWINLADMDEPLNEEELRKPYPFDWDAGSPSVNFASNKISYKTIYGEQGDVILLESAFSDVLTGSWILMKSSAEDGDIAALRVVKAEQVSRADFALSAKTTRLTLEADDGQPDFNRFRLRTTAIYAQSEAMELAGKPVDMPVQGDTIELDHMLERQIRPGQPVIVSGTPTDLEDVVESELAIVKEAVSIAGYTHLVFESKLQRAYRRGSVTVKANLAPATHGESHKEMLGGGDASQPFQTFPLGHAPLTYLVAPVPGGARSSLELRVGGVRWKEAASFFELGPDDRIYVLRRDDEGKTRVAFGDGRSGGRLPTGFENVSASYRTGLGVGGNLAAGRIALLGSQPRFVRTVINPVPAAGGADPESSTDTRRNAPGSVRTFGRIVSLPDFEDFARAFAGVAKAQASLLQIGEARVVHVTIAGADGAPVSAESALYRDLLSAIDSVRDRFQRLFVSSYEKRYFDVTAKVRVHPDYQTDVVVAGVEDALRATFSFERRNLAQGATLSEVMATMQGVEGVQAVDLDALRFSHERGLKADTKIVMKVLSKVPARLSALRARRDASGGVLPAQHLSVYGIKLVEMT
jgi:predicted phage baseplate assembly protein